MYTSSYSISLKGSISIGQNNLSILRKNSINSYAVVGKNSVYLTKTENGKNISENQIIPRLAKESSENQQLFQLTEAKFVDIRERAILVILSTKGIFFYEEDGSSLIYFYQLNSRSGDQQILPRGLADLGNNLISIGTSSGKILIFEIPPKGNKISIINEINDQDIQSAITALTVDSQKKFLCAGDSSGNCVVFNKEDVRNFRATSKFNEDKFPVTCLCTWKDYLIASYSNGVISIYDLVERIHLININAHARWIYSLDVSKDLLVSSGEDCYFRVWQLNEVNRKLKVNHLYSGLVTDTLLTSVQFNNNTDELCISSFDNSEIFVYKLK